MAQQGPQDDEQGEAVDGAGVDPSASSPPPAAPASPPPDASPPKVGAKGGVQRTIKPTPPRNELTLAQVKKLRRVLVETKFNVTRTARLTKISRTTIYRYLREGDPPRGIAPLLGSAPGPGEAPSGALPDDEESAPVDAAPPPTTTTPAASTGAPPAVPETPPAVDAMPPVASSTPPLTAPRPTTPAVGGGKVQTQAEADREMLAVARMTRQLLGAKTATVAKLARELEQGVPDPLNPKVPKKRRLSQDDRELLALFGAARVTPESVIRLYEIETGILRRIATEHEALGAHDETADALRQELVDLLGPTANTPEDS